MFKTHNNLVHSHLWDKTPPGVGNVTFHYNTRNSSNYFLPKCRLKKFLTSHFLSDTFRNWNTMSSNTRDAIFISNFMNKKLQSNFTRLPKYLSFSWRFLNIIHTKLRHIFIPNSDLQWCNVIANPIHEKF